MEDWASSVAIDDTADHAPPDELACPITQMLLRNPVILMSGHAVELDALMKFWETQPFSLTNPVTREKLSSLDELALVPGLQARTAIDAYLARLPPNVIPDGWLTKDPGTRSTREELRRITHRVHQIASSAGTIRLGGRLPHTADPRSVASLGVYDRDPQLMNGRPSYTARGGGSHAIWFSAIKADGSDNGFWHVAEVAFKGGACGHLGVHDPSAIVAERISGRWQAVAQATPEAPDEAASGERSSSAPSATWIAASEVRCDAEGTMDDLAALMASSASVVVVRGTLPPLTVAELSHAKAYASCLGMFDRDEEPTDGRPSYTRRGGSAALWYSSESQFWHLGNGAHRGSPHGWFHSHAPLATAAERICGPWSLRCSSAVAAQEGMEQDMEYVEVPLRCQTASVELSGVLPDVLIGQPDPHGLLSYFGKYDLHDEDVGGRPAYVQRGSRALRALWYSESTGFWYFGPMERLGQPVGPICARGVPAAGDNSVPSTLHDPTTGTGGPERLKDVASWQVKKEESWVRALMMRCRPTT